MNNSNLKSKQNGFSIIELMLALVISIATISGLFSIYLNVRTSQDATQANARIQESGRFALEYLKRDIRMVGYRGCSSGSSPTINVVASNLPSAYDPLAEEVVGYDMASGWTTDTIFASQPDFTSRIKTGTDALSVSRMSSLNAQVIQEQISSSSSVVIDTLIDLNIENNDILYISDCNDADIFSASTVTKTTDDITLQHASSSNDSISFNKTYEESATVAKYQSKFYFVGNTNRTNKSGDIIYALYEVEVDYSSATTNFILNELIEGVENLQILYGEVLPSTGNVKYVPIADVTDMQNVSSIQLGLLITSQDNVRQTTDNNTYHLAQTAISAGTGINTHTADKRLRHAFNTTIQIRNR